MHPVLFELGGLSVRSHGLLVAAGLAVGLIVTLRAGARLGLDRRRLFDATLWCLVGGLVGARLVGLLVTLPSLLAEPWAWVDLLGAPRRVPRALLPWEGGLVHFGGLAGGAAAALVFARLRGVPFGTLTDVLAPGLSLASLWGRLGCLLSGACFGKAGGGALAVAYGPGSVAYEAHRDAGLLLPPQEATYGLHPVQLYEAGVELLLSALLLGLLARRRVGGQVALTYVACQGAARFVLEVLRGDRDRGFLGEPLALGPLNWLLGVDGGSPSLLSVSQLAAVLALLVCAWVWLLVRNRRARESFEGGRPGA